MADAPDTPQLPADLQARVERRAQRLADQLVARYRADIGALDTDGDRARQAIARAANVCGAAYARYNAALRAFRELQLLMAAFPHSANGTKPGPPPQPPNIAVVLFSLEYERLRKLRPFVVGRTASMTPHQAHAAERAAVAKYAQRYARELSEDARALFVEAGLLAPEGGAR